MNVLAGGNPQIAKADGDLPVQAYIAVPSAPNVRKGVKWNSPFYGIEGRGWFLGFHVFTRGRPRAGR